MDWNQLFAESRAKLADMSPRLSLELLCGADNVSPEHPGYFDASQSLYHPGQQRACELAKQRGIDSHIEPSHQRGVNYSDAYLYFEPHQTEAAAQVLKEAGHPGHYIDSKDQLSPEEEAHVRKIARRESWDDEDL